MITLERLSRRYGDVTAVQDVSLTIPRGAIVGLLGHNGAGKTTMMKMLTGFLEPSDGRVLVDVATHREAVQRRIGYLPENAPTYPEMLVQDYILMMAELRGVAASARRAAVLDAARDTDLLDRLTSPISTLSKGYRQRVGLAQAIVHRPDVLVLDEPTNGLDPTQIQSIRALIRRLGERSTILLSTHILQEIEAVCQRVIVMIGGTVAADAPLAELVGTSTLLVSLDAAAANVPEVLGRLDGVVSVSVVGDDPQLPGFVRWTLSCGDAYPVGEVLELARQHGWTVGAVTPERRTLEAVFQSLEHAHVSRQIRPGGDEQEVAA